MLLPHSATVVLNIANVCIASLPAGKFSLHKPPTIKTFSVGDKKSITFVICPMVGVHAGAATPG